VEIIAFQASRLQSQLNWFLEQWGAAENFETPKTKLIIQCFRTHTTQNSDSLLKRYAAIFGPNGMASAIGLLSKAQHNMGQLNANPEFAKPT
jgi:hypothetical protein